MAWFTRLFPGRRKRARAALHLVLDADAADGGRHRVRASLRAGDKLVPIDDLSAATEYGFSIPVDGVDYSVGPRDRETLLGLSALDPTPLGEGEHRFDVRPPILEYLRKNPDVEESPESRSYVVKDEGLKPQARVDFDPATGITVKTGFALDEDGPLASAGELPRTPDGGYVRMGKTFVPITEPASDRAEALLREGRVHVDLERIPEFFQRDLVLLKTEFQAVLTDSAARIQIVTDSPEPRVRVSSNEPGWLDFQVDYVAGNVVLPADLIRSARDGVVQVDSHTFLNADLSAARRVEEEISKLQPDVTPDGYRLPIDRFASLEDFIDKIGGIAELSADYQRFLDGLTGFQARDDYRLPAPIERQLEVAEITLRPYQRAGVHWLAWLRTTHLHGILADDMGLGKTMQSVLALGLGYQSSKHQKHSLIVCPRSVLHHWYRELHRLFPEMRIVEHHGPSRRSGLFNLPQPIVFITTYDTARSDIETLQAVPFFYVILDEATRIKNPEAQRSQAIKRLNAAHRLSLSGTPVENRPEELWSQFDFLMKGHLGKYGTFQRVFSHQIGRGEESASERLAARIKPFILRREKKDVATDLPEKIEMDEWCELTDEQRGYYAQIQREYGPKLRKEIESDRTPSTASILPILTMLKQVCDHPALIDGETSRVSGRSVKFDIVVQKIREIVKNQEQVVVFTHFLGVLDLLEIALRGEKISYVRLDGSTANRQELIDRFNDRRAPAALCSLKAISHGVNMQSANHVIHVDRWWNPAEEDQANDRVHRIGQEKTVYIHRVMVQGTLEEKIDSLQTRKRKIARGIIDPATRGELTWTKEELLSILEPIE